MKLRNKKTGEIREVREILIDGMFKVASLAELKEWEDCEEEQPQQRYYLMNKKTGYIITFNSLDEADTFQREVDGWRFVRVY